MKYSKRWSWLFFIFISFSIFAQQKKYITNTYFDEDGLPLNFINDIQADGKGFLWIASSGGVSKFNGLTFENFYTNHNDNKSLPRNVIYGIEKDSLHNLWLSSSNSLIKLDVDRDSFSTILQPTQKKYVSSWGMTKDKDGWIWLDINDQLERFNPISEEHQIITIDTLPSFDFLREINYVYPYLVDTLWISTKSGIWRAINQGKNYTIQEIKINNFDSPVACHQIIKKRNQLFIGTNRGLLHLHQDSLTAYAFPITNEINFPSNQPVFLTHVSIDSDGKLWAGYRNHILSYDFKIGQSSVFKLMIPNSPNAQTTPVQALHQKDNNHWFACSTGLWNFRQIEKWFDHYPYLPNGQKSIASSTVYSVFEERNKKLWIGTEHGITSIEEINGEELYKTYAKQDFVPPPLNTLSIKSIIKSKNGQLIIGTNRHGLFLLDENENRFHAIKTDNQENTSPSFFYNNKKLISDENGTLWLARLNGFSAINPDNFTIKNYDIQPSPPDVMAYPGYSFSNWSYEMTDIIEDNLGTIWGVGANKNLYRYNEKLDTFQPVRSFDNYEFLFSILPHSQVGTIFLGTFGSGLIAYDAVKDTILYAYSSSDGLASTTIYGLKEDSDGLVWISTSKGISCLDPFAKTIKNFGKQDGIPFQEFNNNACFKSEKGELFFGGMDGVIKFHPQNIPKKDTSYVANLMFTNIKVLNTDIPIPSGSQPVIELTHNTNSAEVSFINLDFVLPKNIEYKYSLKKPLDNNPMYWSLIGTSKTIPLTSLTSGSYDLHIKASDGRNNWSVNKLLLLLNVAPPWWEEWKVIPLLTLVSFSAVIFAIITFFKTQQRKKRSENLIRESKLKYQKNEATLNALKHQMNPHFIFNLLNAINALIAKSNVIEANRFLSKFAGLTRKTLYYSQMDLISMEDEIKFLQQYLDLHTLNLDKGFAYQINITEETIKQLRIYPMLIQPFVENAIEHGIQPLQGRDGMVRINFKKDNTHLIVFVLDNGLGIPQDISLKDYSATKKENIGIRNSIERIIYINEMFDTTLDIQILNRRPENGTAVEIKIPLYKIQPATSWMESKQI